jgi:hypothetical protein
MNYKIATEVFFLLMFDFLLTVLILFPGMSSGDGVEELVCYIGTFGLVLLNIFLFGKIIKQSHKSSTTPITEQNTTENK